MRAPEGSEAQARPCYATMDIITGDFSRPLSPREAWWHRTIAVGLLAAAALGGGAHAAKTLINHPLAAEAK